MPRVLARVLARVSARISACISAREVSPRVASRPRARRAAFVVWSAIVVLGVGAAFWRAGLHAVSARVWPAPLDDVYIHFGFARSLALGSPSTWIPGNGYSSGGTSLLYPVLLAPGWLLGARGPWLGAWAAALAAVALVDLACSLRRAVGPRAPLAVALPLLLVAVPVLDWSWFSGMEVAVLGAAIGRGLCAVRAVEASGPSRRPRAQRVAGLWLATLPALRPEAAPLALALAVAVAHASGQLSALRGLARAAGPTLALLAAQAAANRALTGEWSAAGAVRKLIPSDPYRAAVDVAVEVLRNLARLRAEAFEIALGGPPFHLAFFALAGVALLERRSRRLAAPLAAGALGALGLVALNSTAPFQNLRYAAPSLAMLLALAWLGADRLARRGAPGAAAASLLVAACLSGPARSLGRQIDHFARASRNIAEQQVEVGRRLAAMSPPPARVFVGDAGAIPYVSGLAAVDGLGLGGTLGLPFARASVHGVPAVIELVERMREADRPDVLAVYDGWWGGLVPEHAGERLFSVRIEDNVICGGDEKVVYRADWSSLGPPPGRLPDGWVDALDVADLVDERAHDVELPGPRAGWIVGARRTLPDGSRRFDAGRILPAGRRLSFRAGAAARRIVLRSDGRAAVRVMAIAPAPARELAARVELAAGEGEAWGETDAPMAEVAAGERIAIEALEGEARIFSIGLR